MFLQNQIFLPADFNFSCGATKISNNQGLVGVFLPARLFSSPPLSVLIPLRSKPFLAIEGNLVFSLFFSGALFLSSSPEPFRKPRNKGFSGNVLSSSFGEKGRQDVFSGRFFREIFLEIQEPFGEVSQAVSMEKIWEEERERGWKGGRGCGGGG